MLDHLKDQGVDKVSFVRLNKQMANMGRSQFSQEVFQQAYDYDDRIQELVDDFNDKGIYFKSEDSIEPEDDGSSGDTVKQMAKRATKIGK